MSTTAPAPIGSRAVAYRTGRIAVITLFAVLAALLLAALLIPLLAGSGGVGSPQPAPVPAPAPAPAPALGLST